MQNFVFEPWVGNKFGAGNRFGVRVLVLGESHYGNATEGRPTLTIEIIRWLAQTDRHPFFTKVAKVLLGLDQSIWLDDHARREIWEHVAFYNYIQGLVGNGPRIRPSPELWKDAPAYFFEVLTRLQPQVILVLGKALADHLPVIDKSIEVCRIKHPATGFAYHKWNPVFAEALRRAKEKPPSNAAKSCIGHENCSIGDEADIGDARKRTAG